MIHTTDFDTTWFVVLGIKAVRVLVLVMIGWWLSGYVERKMRDALARVYPDMLRINLLVKMASSSIIAITLLAICTELSINISAILAAAGVMGVAIGFAAQTSVANVISGLFLMLEHPFNLGDVIVVESVEGKVAEINLFAIIMHTHDNQVVRIPHEKLLKSIIFNLTQLNLRRYELTLSVSPDQDMQKVIQAIKTVVAQNKYCVQTPAPTIRALAVTGDYLEIFIGAWVPVAHLTEVRANFVFELKTYFEQQNIALACMLPQLLCKEDYDQEKNDGN